MTKKITVMIALILSLAMCLSACGLRPIEETPADPASTAAPDTQTQEEPDAHPADEPQETAETPAPVDAPVDAKLVISQKVENRTVAASGTDIFVKPAEGTASSGSDIPVAQGSASGSDVKEESPRYTVSLSSDNRYKAAGAPLGTDGALTIFVDEAYWDDSGLMLICTVMNKTASSISDPVISRLIASNAETDIADVRVGTLSGCVVPAGGSVYWELLIPDSLISSPRALLDTLKIEVTFA